MYFRHFCHHKSHLDLSHSLPIISRNRCLSISAACIRDKRHLFSSSPFIHSPGDRCYWILVTPLVSLQVICSYKDAFVMFSHGIFTSRVGQIVHFFVYFSLSDFNLSLCVHFLTDNASSRSFVRLSTHCYQMVDSILGLHLSNLQATISSILHRSNLLHYGYLHCGFWIIFVVWMRIWWSRTNSCQVYKLLLQLRSWSRDDWLCPDISRRRVHWRRRGIHWCTLLRMNCGVSASATVKFRVSKANFECGHF